MVTICFQTYEIFHVVAAQAPVSCRIFPEAYIQHKMVPMSHLSFKPYWNWRKCLTYTTTVRYLSRQKTFHEMSS